MNWFYLKVPPFYFLISLLLISGCTTTNIKQESSQPTNYSSSPESSAPASAANDITLEKSPEPIISAEDSLIRTSSGESLVHMDWKQTEPDTTLKINFGNDNAEIVFGMDHPNGTKAYILFPDANSGWPLDLSISDGTNAFDDLGYLNDGFKLQAGIYDFDSDGTYELIVAAGDGLIDMNLWVFSFTHVDNFKKINPIRQELATSAQSYVVIDNSEIFIPYGSQGLFDSFKYVDQEFMQPVR
ncbi:hypothetical protein [Cohnella abietis]|uniref:Lipoprotein n=1 Tax=Cohnella abietis TaxID=2507935 RepID=A0A3T1D7G0_9BACL|nr:hypothetical protein [Cohnella abietis]BBI34022.1 hypothetical protein KCTCHS21_34210 [Cohnella abietis]